MRTAVQLYTLRDVDATLVELPELVAAAGFDGVEFAGLDDPDPVAVAEALDAAALDVAGAHVDVDRVEADLDAVAGTYRSLGCDTIVVPRLDEACFADEAAVDATARRLSNLAVRVEEHGLRLLYHNHDHEFVRLDELTAFERLVDATSDRVGFELDVGWAAIAGHDPVDLVERFGDRIPVVHLKDVDAESGEPVDLGEGDVDVDGCVRAARGADVEWLVFEHDRPTDPVASMEAAAERLLSVH